MRTPVAVGVDHEAVTVNQLDRVTIVVEAEAAAAEEELPGSDAFCTQPVAVVQRIPDLPAPKVDDCGAPIVQLDPFVV